MRRVIALLFLASCKTYGTMPERTQVGRSCSLDCASIIEDAERKLKQCKTEYTDCLRQENDLERAKANAADFERRQASDQRATRNAETLRLNLEAQRQRADEEARLARQQEEQRKFDADEDFERLPIPSCTQGGDEVSCEKIMEFVRAHPTSKHVSEAMNAIRTSLPLVTQRRESRDWEVADVESCKRPKLSSDCDSLRKFAARYPSGAHSADAEKILKASEQKISALEKSEAAKARADAAAEEAKARAQAAKRAAEVRAACRGDCQYQCSSVFNRFDQCFSGCVQVNCD